MGRSCRPFLNELSTLRQTTANNIGKQFRLENINKGRFGLTGGQVPKFQLRCRFKYIN